MERGQEKALLLRTGTGDVHDDGLGSPAEGQGCLSSEMSGEEV